MNGYPCFMDTNLQLGIHDFMDSISMDIHALTCYGFSIQGHRMMKGLRTSLIATQNREYCLLEGRYVLSMNPVSPPFPFLHCLRFPIRIANKSSRRAV